MSLSKRTTSDLVEFYSEFHENNFILLRIFQNLLKHEDFDCLLCVDNISYPIHKLVLASSSSLFAEFLFKFPRVAKVELTISAAHLRAQDWMQLLSFLYCGHAIISNSRKQNVSKFRTLLDHLAINRVNCKERKNSVYKLLRGTTFENPPNKVMVDFSLEATKEPRILLSYDANFDLKREMKASRELHGLNCDPSNENQMVSSNLCDGFAKQKTFTPSRFTYMETNAQDNLETPRALRRYRSFSTIEKQSNGTDISGDKRQTNIADHPDDRRQSNMSDYPDDRRLSNIRDNPYDRGQSNMSDNPDRQCNTSDKLDDGTNWIISDNPDDRRQSNMSDYPDDRRLSNIRDNPYDRGQSNMSDNPDRQCNTSDKLDDGTNWIISDNPDDRRQSNMSDYPDDRRLSNIRDNPYDRRQSNMSDNPNRQCNTTDKLDDRTNCIISANPDDRRQSNLNDNPDTLFNTNDNLDIVDVEVEVETSEDSMEIESSQETNFQRTNDRNSQFPERIGQSQYSNGFQGILQHQISERLGENRSRNGLVEDTGRFHDSSMRKKGQEARPAYVTVIECEDYTDNRAGLKIENQGPKNMDQESSVANGQGSFNPHDASGRFDSENVPPGEQSMSNRPSERFFSYFQKENNLREAYRNEAQGHSNENRFGAESDDFKKLKIVGNLDFHMTETNEALFRDNIDVLTEVLTNASPVNKGHMSTPQSFKGGVSGGNFCNTSSTFHSPCEGRNYFSTTHGKRDKTGYVVSASRRKQVLNERPCDSDIDFFETNNTPAKRKMLNKPFRKSLRRLNFNTFAYKRAQSKNSASGGTATQTPLSQSQSSTERPSAHTATSVTFRSLLREVQMCLSDVDNQPMPREQKPSTFHAIDSSRSNSFDARTSREYRETRDRADSGCARGELSAHEWCSEEEMDTVSRAEAKVYGIQVAAASSAKRGVTNNSEENYEKETFNYDEEDSINNDKEDSINNDEEESINNDEEESINNDEEKVDILDCTLTRSDEKVFALGQLSLRSRNPDVNVIRRLPVSAGEQKITMQDSCENWREERKEEHVENCVEKSSHKREKYEAVWRKNEEVKEMEEGAEKTAREEKKDEAEEMFKEKFRRSTRDKDTSKSVISQVYEQLKELHEDEESVDFVDNTDEDRDWEPYCEDAGSEDSECQVSPRSDVIGGNYVRRKLEEQSVRDAAEFRDDVNTIGPRGKHSRRYNAHDVRYEVVEQQQGAMNGGTAGEIVNRGYKRNNNGNLKENVGDTKEDGSGLKGMNGANASEMVNQGTINGETTEGMKHHRLKTARIVCNTASVVYYCTPCDRRYHTKTGFSQHKRFECGKSPAFQCLLCSHEFKRKSSLKRHLRQIHDNALENNFVVHYDKLRISQHDSPQGSMTVNSPGSMNSITSEEEPRANYPPQPRAMQVFRRKLSHGYPTQ